MLYFKLGDSMENKLQEWIFDNLPGNISQNPMYKELRNIVFKDDSLFAFKATQSFYKKLCEKLGTSEISEIQIIDGRGDYIEFEFAINYDGYSTKAVAKSNDKYSELLVQSKVHPLKIVEQHDLIIKNDGSYALNHFQFSNGQHFRSCREFDKNGNLTKDYIEPKTTFVERPSFTTFDVLYLPDLISNLKEFIEINNFEYIGPNGEKILKNILQTLLVSGIDESDKIILPMDFVYRLARLVHLSEQKLEKEYMELSFFLIEKNNIFFKCTALLKLDKVEWIMIPITKTEAKEYYDSDKSNVTFDGFKDGIEGPTLK